MLLDTTSHVMMGPAGAIAAGAPRHDRFGCSAGCRRTRSARPPETGRQHQIRVHFAAIGHPIVGDKLYGAGEALFMRACDEGVTPELLAAFDGLPRHALHAHRLRSPTLSTRRAITVESPSPPDLAAHVEELSRQTVPAPAIC